MATSWKYAVAAFCLVLMLGLLTACGRPTAQEANERAPVDDGPPLILAASSLQESLEAAADAWVVKGHTRPTLSFAATSAIARQIDARAPADLFLSADQDWMNHVEARGLIDPTSRANFVGNSIVLVTARGKDFSWKPGEDLSAALGDGRLAMADPDAVPAGKYGKAALKSLGQWEAVSADIVRGENVRAALAFVERGAAAAGVVYGTDAAASSDVRVAATFPASSHPPIVYPLAQLKTSRSKDAAAFRGFLLSPEGQAIFRRYGFRAP